MKRLPFRTYEKPIVARKGIAIVIYNNRLEEKFNIMQGTVYPPGKFYEITLASAAKFELFCYTKDSIFV